MPHDLSQLALIALAQKYVDSVSKYDLERLESMLHPAPAGATLSGVFISPTLRALLFVLCQKEAEYDERKRQIDALSPNKRGHYRDLEEFKQEYSNLERLYIACANMECVPTGTSSRLFVGVNNECEIYYREKVD
jgi:hypothetical protein